MMTHADALPTNDIASPTPVSRLRRSLAWVLAFAALIVTLLGAREMSAVNPYPRTLERSVLVALSGIALMLLALWVWQPADPVLTVFSRDDAKRERWPSVRARRRMKAFAVIATLAGFAVLVGVNTGVFGIVPLQSMSHHVQFMLFVLCCLLLIWGLSDRPLFPPLWNHLERGQQLELAGLALLTLVALVLRLHDLEAVRAFIDEMNFLEPLLRFKTEPNLPLLQPMSRVAAFPLIYPYLQSLAWDVVPSGLIAIRIPAAIFGTLTIPALYLLARQFFDWRIAALAAVLLTTHPVHVQWSRLGMNNAADAFFGVLAFGLLVRGVRRGGSWHFAAAGVSLGLTHYFYEGGRLTFTALAIIWFLYFMVLAFWRTLPRRSIVIFIVSAVIVAAPVYLTLLALDRPFTARLDVTHTANLVPRKGDLWMMLYFASERLQKTLFYFVTQAEHVVYYGGQYAFFHVYLVPALFLGIAAVLRRVRTPAGLLLLLWGAGPILLASYLIVDGGTSPRLLIAFPIYALVCALGISDVLRLLWGRRTAAILLSMAVFALVVSVLDVTYYFGIHTRDLTRQERILRPEHEIVFHARDYPAGTHVHYFTRSVTWPGEFNLRLKALNPELTGHEKSGEPPDLAYIQSIPYGEAHEVYIYTESRDKYIVMMLEKRFILSAPIRWPQPYNRPGIEFVAYQVLGKRINKPPARTTIPAN